MELKEIVISALKDFSTQFRFDSQTTPYRSSNEVYELFARRIVSEIKGELNKQIRGAIIADLTEEGD